MYYLKFNKAFLSVLFLSVLWFSGCQQELKEETLASPAFDEVNLAQMRQTQASNMQAVIERKLLNTKTGDFITQNPYKPVTPLSDSDCQANVNCQYATDKFWFGKSEFPAQSIVHQWWQERALDANKAEVCGLRFENADKTQYHLQSFANQQALNTEPGYLLTHFQACGTCSSLKDLAVYGEKDLTKMAKTCSKRFSLDDKKSCMMDIGFTEACAETWAYNGQHTAQRCALICVQEYGLLAILRGTEHSSLANAQGELNTCLLCDEMMSGPGFQYSAGRIRRNSGIISEIDRPEDQVYTVAHDYFD